MAGPSTQPIVYACKKYVQYRDDTLEFFRKMIYLGKAASPVAYRSEVCAAGKTASEADNRLAVLVAGLRRAQESIVNRGQQLVNKPCEFIHEYHAVNPPCSTGLDDPPQFTICSEIYSTDGERAGADRAPVYTGKGICGVPSTDPTLAELTHRMGVNTYVADNAARTFSDERLERLAHTERAEPGLAARIVGRISTFISVLPFSFLR